MNWLREPDAEPIPGYTLVAPLGTGGFGEVWKCVAPGGLNKAIKFVFGNLNSLDGDSEKAEQEFKALERVKAVRHPFVLSMDQIQIVGGELIIIMELADKSLHDCFNEYQQAGRPGIPRDLLLGFLSDAAEGLDHLIEKHNLQHLDVKPKNLFLIADRVKVADFGLVKHLERQSSAGLMGGVTPVYAAPETFSNKLSKQTDQYSLAVVYIELLTGQRPFTGKNIRQLALQHMTEPPKLDMLPEADRPVVARALAKNPDDRFPSCSAFVRALVNGGQAVSTTGGRTLTDLALPRLRATTTPDLDLGTVTPAPTPGPTRLAPVDALLGNDETSGGGSGGGRTPPPRRPTDLLTATVSRLEVGILRPAILIGVGSFGKRAIQQIRCRLLDRVGDLNQVPSFRFLYLDVEPGTAPSRASAAVSDVALEAEHVVHLPLQPVTAYRRKQLDQILEWLPREKLYSIPRSLSVEGSRALGRLAFCDHYLKVTTRLKNDITVATHPEAIKQSADQTGLSPRAKVPSVYVFASATGGSGGMLLDLGHAVRRVLDRFNMSDAPVTAFVYCGAPEDPGSPPAELANIFATLTELNHYADPDVPFAARYGVADGPKADGRGLPFSATYLLPMAQRTGEAFRDCVSHLSGYIAQELTTPLGGGLEEIRRRTPAPGRTPFRGFGTFGVWFPRGLLLRSAARQLCTAVLRQWAGIPTGGPPDDARRLIDHIYQDPRLTPEAVQQFILQEASRGPDGGPMEAIGKWYAGAVEQLDPAARRGEGANWATAVWDQAKDLLGLEPTTETDSPYRRGRLSRALDQGVRNAVAAWENELGEMFRSLDEIPGPRLAAAEAALREVGGAFLQAAQVQEQLQQGLAAARAGARQAAQAAADAVQAGSGAFSLFGVRSGRPLKAFADRVKQFIDARAAEDMAAVTALFYRRVCGRLEDRLRDAGYARELLTKLADSLDAPTLGTESGSGRVPSPTESDEATQTTLQMSNTVRVVLPNGDDHLDRAAGDLLTALGPDDYRRLHDALQRLVVEPRGGLTRLVRSTPDLHRGLAVPLVEQTTAFLSDLVPVQDVTEVELSSAEAKAGGLQKRIASYLRLAAPQAPGPAEEEKTYILVPATDAGLRYAREAKKVAPKAVTVMVQGQGTDLMFCREQGYLRSVDLMKMIEPCWEAYQEFADEVETNPHARFDVPEWMPLVAK
jgi:serine/threonine protein kinase